SVDRDDDLGTKANIDGPVIGREEVIKAATMLAVKDPEDSDANALFSAVKLYDELKGKYKVNVVALTGSKRIGIESDKKIGEQLSAVLKKYPSDYAILVTDGSEDEHVMPIIQSRIPILSVKRVIIKQSEQLESTYYKIKDFIKESMENPKFSRLIFGLPSIMLLTFAIFGSEGYRLILGIAGLYLFVKGFKLEEYATNIIDELKTSFIRRRLSFFLYIISIAIFSIAIFRGYNYGMEWVNMGIFESAAAFLNNSIYIFWIAGSVAWIGKVVGSKKINVLSILPIPLFGLAITIVIFNASILILQPDFSPFSFVISIIIGFVLIFLAIIMERFS
ncbi:MAG TPA: DUF373 family protein, partial [Candidatus Aenigmarchaeota archaeon]|nr:DUF373 family protein [Candidatus Aenigmarchaeota archaeon]